MRSSPEVRADGSARCIGTLLLLLHVACGKTATNSPSEMEARGGSNAAGGTADVDATGSSQAGGAAGSAPDTCAEVGAGPPSSACERTGKLSCAGNDSACLPYTAAPVAVGLSTSAYEGALPRCTTLPDTIEGGGSSIAVEVESIQEKVYPLDGAK